MTADRRRAMGISSMGGFASNALNHGAFRVVTTALAYLSLGLGSVSLAAEVRFRNGFPVTKPSEVFPLSEVKRGLKGVGYTVFAENKAEPFEVEVLGVMEDMLGPGEDVILAKLHGKKIQFTGVISGMSGSPVYIDGRLLGAVAYRFGNFSKEPIAGITPIRRMLPLLKRDAKSEHLNRNHSKLVQLGAGWIRDRGRAPKNEHLSLEYIKPRSQKATSNSFQPIRTPLAAAGLHPVALTRLAQSIDAHEIMPAAVGKNSAGRVNAAPILPGAPVAALLTRGDILLAAIGTVTYVHNNDVLAFGHPFVGQGKVSFPLATAAILNTLASPAGSYKQGIAAQEVGVIYQDRLTAIAGQIGTTKRAAMIPVSVKINDHRANRVKTTTVDIVKDPLWMPMLADTVLTNAVLQRLAAEAGGTVVMKAGFQLSDRYLEVRDSFSAPAPLQVASYPARDVGRIVSILTQNRFKKADLNEIRLQVDIKPEVQIMRVESISLQPTQVKRGEEVRVSVLLRPYRGTAIERELRLRIPLDAPLGRFEIYVGGGLELDRRDTDARGRLEPQSLDEILGILADRRPSNAIYARAYFSQPGVRIGTEVLASLPPSMQATLQTQPFLKARAIEERPGPSTNWVVDGIIQGALRAKAEVVTRGKRYKSSR